ncbi:hypothetical protein RBH29_13660 [Herbivorax sp. ANBcel31]|uniref:hypothetical protein n=1 Tax=Herbivorax sp. ANBcel31 TaxID=3069754 RepID=UPI0027B69AD4|nr:hypothetical protein [Herbivorax sp. ANBcel31]MDQ2087473.1 hypothetical protein [Herbivorax sp. ANBcel31]
MSTYNNIALQLNGYFSKHNFFKILLPLDLFIVYGCVGAKVLNIFIGIGSLLGTLMHYGFFLGLLLAFSNLNNKVVYRGLFVYAGVEAFYLLKAALPPNSNLHYHNLIPALIFGYMGYVIFKNN